MLRSHRSLILAALLPAFTLGCGRPPVPLDSRTLPASRGDAAGHHGGDATATPLDVRGQVRLVGSLATRTEGRLFLFVEDAHGGGAILNRAYNLEDEAFSAVSDGERTLEFELGEADRLGNVVSDGHLVLVARLDADGEVLTSDDALATASIPFDAGDGPLSVVLEAESE